MNNFLLALFSFLMISCASSTNTKVETNNQKTEKIENSFLQQLQGAWKLSELKGIRKEKLKKSLSVPNISFDNLRVNGNDSCNTFLSSVKKIEEKNIEFSLTMGTLMYCSEMEIAGSFNKNFILIKSYSLVENTLTFFDKEGEKLFVFIKK